MKKTIIALMALTGVAMGGTEAITLKTEISGAYFVNLSTPAVYDTKKILETNDVTVSLVSRSGGKVGAWNQTTAWTNAAAIDEMNTTLNTDFTVANIASLQSAGNWGNSGYTDLSFDFNKALAGESVTLYVFASSALGNSTNHNVNVVGLAADYSVTYASANGSGFNTEVSTGQDLTLYKITGVLTHDSVVLSSTTAKNGWAMAAFTYTVPEPATATLSLLALAGLAARRRRK